MDEPTIPLDVVPKGHKFAGTVLTHLSRNHLVAPGTRFDLAPSVSLFFDAKVDLPEHRRTWLGLDAEHFDGPSAVLLVWEEARQPADHQAADVARQARRWLLALSLFARPSIHNHTMSFDGARLPDGSITIQTTGAWDGHGPWSVVPTPFVPAHLDSARTALKTYDLMHSSKAFARAKRCIDSFWRATLATQGEDRLFGFVRSVEGLLSADGASPTKELFKKRGGCWASVAEIGTVLGELYQLRNAVAHLLEWDDKVQVPNQSTVELVVAYRLLQADRFASGVISRLLLSPSVSAAFETKETAGPYWSASPEKAANAFGFAVDLDLSEDDVQWIAEMLR